MKFKNVFIVVVVFLLASCAPAMTPTPIQVTVTPEATFTPLPTATATLTPIPTVTFTPTPQLPPAVITDIESRLTGYTVVGDSFQDPQGRLIPNMRIEPSSDETTWRGIVPPYEYDHVDEEGNVTTYSMSVDTSYKAEEFALNSDGNLTYPAHEWRDGEWVRRNVIHTEYSGTEETDTGVPLYTVQEATLILDKETQKLREKLNLSGYELPDEYLNMSMSYMHTLLQPMKGRFPYKGINYIVYRPKKGSGVWCSTTISVFEEKTNKYNIYRVSSYCWSSVENGGKYGFLGFKDTNDERQILFVDRANLNDPDGFLPDVSEFRID